MGLRGLLSILFLCLLCLLSVSVAPLAPAGAQGEFGVSTCAPDCKVFLPAVQKPDISLDLQAANIELTQAVQSLANDATLIANRPTLARVTVSASGSSQPVAGVVGQLHALRNNVELPSSPLSASFSAPRAPNRLTLNDTLNYWLPSDWTSAPVNLYLLLNPAQTLVENNYGNNRWPATGYLLANFRTTTPLQIVVVPINASFAGLNTTPASPFDYVTPFLWQSYPIAQYTVHVHAPIAYAGASNPPSGNDWQAMLNAVSAVHSAEDLSTRDKEYLGVVNVPCNGGCIAGIAWVPSALGSGYYFSAVAFDGGGSANWAGPVVAHEIGHNLGRNHAPSCGGAPYDAAYPNSMGLLDDLGFNIVTSALYNPAGYHDFMSYCSGVWTSKYGYNTIFRFRNGGAAAAAGASASADVFAIAGSVDASHVQVLPTVRLQAPLTPEDALGEYRLELRDAGDRVLQTHRFSLQDTDGAAGGFQLNVPADDRALRMLIYRGERLVFDQRGNGNLRVSLHRPETDNPSQLSWDADGALRYMLRGSRDGGKSWQVLGLSLSAQQLSLDAQYTPGGDVLFEVQASDGVRAVADHQSARMSKHAPQAHIVPGTPTVTPAGEPLSLSAIAYDPEDGALSDGALVWSSNQDGFLGAGTTLWLEYGLSAGTHLITLNATDTDSNTGHAEIVIMVK